MVCSCLVLEQDESSSWQFPPLFTCWYVPGPHCEICLATDDWHSEAATGQLDCEVHAFQSNADLRVHLAPNVTLHQAGFNYTGISKLTQAAEHLPVQGPAHTLGQVFDMLAHRGRRLDVFKIECEGCEWGLVQALSEPHNPGARQPNARHPSQQAVWHPWQAGRADRGAAMQMPVRAQPRWHSSVSIGSEPCWPPHRTVTPSMVAAGMKHSCCKELGFMRSNASSAFQAPQSLP